MPKYQIKNIAIGSLKPHEEICPLHLKNLRAEIKKDGCVKDPIIADKNTLVILDGHHRWNSLLSLGAAFCPCCLVDYQSGEIGVACWRAGEKISKKEVLSAGLSGKLLPQKTSRHLIPDRPLGLNIPLADLR
jgi:hypothetical protein